MGMDLLPRRKGAESQHYNWSGWRALIDFLNGNGCDTSEFDGCNDGRLIRAVTCRAIADCIEAHKHEYNALFSGTPKEEGGYGDDAASDAAKAWRESSGMRQW